jgi:hypothetical protein
MLSEAADLFANDPCADLTIRVSDNWSEYDRVGTSAKYPLAKIRPNCAIGQRHKNASPSHPSQQT